MRSLIVDQSSTRCGIAVVEGPQLIYHGHLTSDRPTSTLRLNEFQKDLNGLVFDFNAGELVFEKIMYYRLPGLDAIEVMGYAASACKAAAEVHGIPWYRVPPPKWKAACSVKGRTSEEQKISARHIAARRWDLKESEIRSSDHADALCMAAYWVVKGEDYRRGMES